MAKKKSTGIPAGALMAGGFNSAANKPPVPSEMCKECGVDVNVMGRDKQGGLHPGKGCAAHVPPIHVVFDGGNLVCITTNLHFEPNYDGDEARTMRPDEEIYRGEDGKLYVTAIDPLKAMGPKLLAALKGLANTIEPSYRDTHQAQRDAHAVAMALISEAEGGGP